MTISYRKDNRTAKQFKKDIKESHEIELNIAIRLAQHFYNQNKKWPKITPSGTDFTGEIQDKATSKEDFFIGSQKFEITRSARPCKKFFHEKVGKVKRCIKENIYMVFVNGISTEQNPDFVIFSPENLKIYSEISDNIYGEVGHPTKNGYISKSSYKYSLEWFDGKWKKLPQISQEAKRQYKSLVKKFNEA